MTGLAAAGSWIADLGQALRAVRRRPLLTGVAIASLAAGIGANAVVFSWIRGVVLRPLPGVPNAAALRVVEPITRQGGRPGVSWPEFQDLQRELTAVPNLAASRMLPLYVGAPDGAAVDRVYGELVSANYFEAIHVRPLLGRAPREGDDPDEPVAVTSYGFWQSRLGGSPGAVGRALRVNGRPLSVIGVAPPEFQGTQLGLSFDLWVPASLAPLIEPGSRELESRDVHGYRAIGWIRPDVSAAAAQLELDAAMARLARTYPASNDGVEADLLGFFDSLRGPPRMLRAVLGVLQLFMALLLTAVCGNIANLLLARASAREREAATRLALGATRWQVARLALAEALVLALPGAALGAALARWGSRALQSLPITGFPIRFQTEVGPVEVAAVLALGVASGLLCGAAPAWHLARQARPSSLHHRASAMGPPASGRLRHGVMGVQSALAAIVLVIAGLVLRSFLDTRTTDPGFDRDGVLLVAYDLAGQDAEPEASRIQRAAARDILTRVRGMPGVEAAAIAVSVPLDIHGLPSRRIAVAGRAPPDGGFDEALVNTVTDGYFAAMRIALLAGSDFGPLAREQGTAEAIVNTAFVRRYFGTGPASAIGGRVRVNGRDRTVVGVSATSLYNAFGEPPTPVVYLPFRDAPQSVGELHLRTSPGREAFLAADVRPVLRTLNPDMALVNVRTLRQHVESNLIFRRVPAQMFAVLGPLLLALAAIGVFAVADYSVTLRTAELGIRLALGAPPSRLVVAVVAAHMAVVVSGVLLGWLAALVVAIVAGVTDAAILAAVPAVLLAVSGAACWLPARRAARIDPASALREWS